MRSRMFIQCLSRFNRQAFHSKVCFSPRNQRPAKVSAISAPDARMKDSSSLIVGQDVCLPGSGSTLRHIRIHRLSSLLLERAQYELLTELGGMKF